jgi:long-chain acyl-CoA synthetase
VSPAPGANLADLLPAAASRAPDRTAIAAGATRLTWADLDNRVDDLARALVARDLRPTDRVALVAAGAIEFVTAYLAALRAGLIVVPVDHTAAAAEITVTLRRTTARLLIADGRTAGTAIAAAAALSGPGMGADVLVLESDRRVQSAPAPDGTAPDGTAPDGPAPDGPVRVDYGGEGIAVLLETAGTGGRPKRAMLSHRALLANLEQCAALDPPPVTAADTVLLALPLFHAYGLNAVLGHALYAGAALVVAHDLGPAQTLDLIAAEGVTSIAGTPAMFAGWAAHPGARAALAGVRVLVSGSAPLPPAAGEAFLAATGKTLWQGYGLTEGAPVVSASMRAKPGSVGRPLTAVATRLLDTAGRPVAEGDPGELWIRGDNLFSGYWPDGSGGPGRDGWYATGDVAWADADGDLFMVSQRPDVIVVSGFPVYPREVEEVVCAHPEVAQAAVVGAADPAAGQVVKLFVVAVAGASVDAETIQAWCAERLGRFKIPRHVEFVTDLPRSSGGRLARGRLREDAGE